MSDSATPWTTARLLRPWDIFCKNIGVGCHFLTCVSSIAFTAEPPGKPLLFTSALILVLLPEAVRIVGLVLECTVEINILRVNESPSLLLYLFIYFLPL